MVGEEEEERELLPIYARAGQGRAGGEDGR